MLNIPKGSKTIILVSTMLSLLLCNANISPNPTIADMQGSELTEDQQDTTTSTPKRHEKRVLQFLKDNWRSLSPVIVPLLMLAAQPAGYLASSAASRACPITWGRMLTSVGVVCAILSSLNLATPEALQVLSRFIGYSAEWANLKSPVTPGISF